MRNETHKVRCFVKQMNDMLVGKKLSKVSRTVDMPMLWFGDIEKVKEGTGGRFSVSFLLTEKSHLDKIYHKKR